MARLFFDVSYTRTQHVSVGITRTVRKLEHELRGLCSVQGIAFTLVSFHTRGFRETAEAALASLVSRAPGAASDRPAARLFRWITGAFFRKVVLAALFLPWALLRLIFSTTSGATFDFLTRSETPVDFREGDVLLLCDASWNYPVWIAARKAREQGARVVLLMYDLIPIRHPGFCFALVPHIFRQWLERMLPLVDAVLSISRATEQDLREFARETGLRLPPSGHFRLGSDAVRTPRDGEEVRAALRDFAGGEAGCFAAIGSFEPKKNYGFLVDVFEGLWARGMPVRLLIIGRESAESAELVRRLRQHPQQGARLLTLFDANDAEIAFAYSNCRALVFPSLAEGFGLPLVEARARGSVVIASDLQVFAELADEEVFLYPRHCARALEALLLEHAHGERRSSAPRMPAFDWKDSAREALAVMDRLLDNAQPHA